MVSGLGGPAGYGENVFSSTPKAAGNNDDGAVEIDVTSVFGPSGINFFGTDYSSIYLNSNGVISFGAAETSYQTPDYGAETTPNIAAFWADVNINSGGEIYWDIDPGAGTVTMTWLNVAPYSGSGTNSFQVVLTDTGGGDFTVEYIYQDIQWTDGGGNPAAAGLTDGGANDFALEGSADPAQLVNYESNDFDGGDPAGSYVLAFSGGAPLIPDGLVEGTGGADVIDAGYAGDPDGDVVDGGDGAGPAGNADTIHAGDGNDTIQAGDGDDSVIGGAGQDSIDGGAGDDTIYGDAPPATSAAESLNWSAQGADGTNVSAGFTQTSGDTDITVSFTDDGDNLPQQTIETSDSVYVAGGEPMATNSSLFLFGTGDDATSTTTIGFASTNPGIVDAVENVQFRISDIDRFTNNHIDQITVTAVDADGNPVAVTLTASGDDTVSGNTITAGGTLDNPQDAQGSVLVQIAGPVSEISISYVNAESPAGGRTGTHGINVSDVHFDSIVLAGDDDIIVGGTGADLLVGGDGDDTITVAQGDTAEGGDGDDTFLVSDLNEAGSDSITITGGEGGETAGDTLDFQGLVNPGDVTITNADDSAGGLSGFATLADGTVVNFSEIETLLICFTAGTRILTPHGQRPIETLRPGDLVLTADHGAQPIRWIGQRSVPATGKLAPIWMRKGLFNNTRDLLVSPQHRMLVQGYRAQLITGQSEVFATAKHMVDGRDVKRMEGDEVTYVHLLFDRHQVIFAEGAATESFHPGHVGLDAIMAPAREELFRIFPELRADLGAYGPTSRTCLRRREAQVLMAA